MQHYFGMPAVQEVEELKSILQENEMSITMEKKRKSLTNALTDRAKIIRELT